METTVKKTFVKDIRTLPVNIRQVVETFVFEQSVQADSIRDLGKIRKISGYSGYYRKRFGDYRVGFKIYGRKIVFYRALHRRDIYRYFP